eukprot:TRINITY_DN26504_c0_g1_i1.p1 TRINITY_DN26504_c0_g1~~TRINITY_DN26504_c0_g1_i1.p1  ORF type:complete len:675 (-),score=112.45 TRINITY_DN26504_c0_g1_i1:1437-3461(-)
MPYDENEGGSDEASQESGDEEKDSTVPEVWKYAEEDKIGKIVKTINEKEEEEVIDVVQEKNPQTGQPLLMWATLRNRFVLVEWLIKKFKRDSFVFDKKELVVFDQWITAQKEKAEREQELLENPEEEDDPEEDGEEPEPPREMWQDVLEALGDEDVNEYIVKRVGELGIYEGGRDAQNNKHGLGKALFMNGDMFIGEYRGNKREGVGTYYWAAEGGSIYSGQWKDNQRWGVGRMVYADGGRYYGDWRYDRKNGRGRYTYPNGDSYTGDWLDDRREGEGSYLFASDSSRYQGSFRNGDFTSGKWVLCGGTVYYGMFKNFKPNGKGVFVFNGKFKQEGEYVRGKWIQRKVSNLNSETAVDLLIHVQQRPINLRFTPEEIRNGTIEVLVKCANFRPFEQWLATVECQQKISIEDIQIRSVDVDPKTKDIKSMRLKVDAYEIKKNAPASEPRHKLAEDTILLQLPTTIVIIMLVNGDMEYVVAVRSPNLAVNSYDQLTLPTAMEANTGEFRGPAMFKASKVFEVQLNRTTMIDLTDMCFGSPTHNLYTHPFHTTAHTNMWLYKQHVHKDYLENLNDRLQFFNKDGDLIKLELHELTSLTDSLADIQSSAALMMLRSLGNRAPVQTTPPQRPPTPPAPEPEPVPLYTEEELAKQRAVVEAEIAAKKKEEEQNNEEDDED